MLLTNSQIHMESKSRRLREKRPELLGMELFFAFWTISALFSVLDEFMIAFDFISGEAVCFANSWGFCSSPSDSLERFYILSFSRLKWAK